jgi:hypothetical protein
MALHLHRVQIAMCGGARACTVYRILSVCLPSYNLERCFCVAHERKVGWSWLVGYGLGQDVVFRVNAELENISFWIESPKTIQVTENKTQRPKRVSLRRGQQPVGD